MRKPVRSLLRILLVCGLSTLLTACALRAMFGNVIIVEDIAEEVNEIITTVFSDSTAAVCLPTGSFYECTYIIDGDVLTSTFYLLSEFGITGVLIDPVVVQVPSNIDGFTATYDDGSGPQPLVVTSRSSFPVDVTTWVTAEVGSRFLMLELPPSVTSSLPSGDPDTAPEFHYSLTFTQTQPILDPVDPVNVKVMLTGKLSLNGYVFYVPMLPCVTDFASIPAVEIPQSVTAVDLQPTIGNLIAQGGNALCDDRFYTYFDVPFQPPSVLYLPIVGKNSG